MQRPFPAFEGPEPYVFVCYAHDDAEIVYPEMTRLRESGFHIWYDEGIEPGSEWSQMLAEHLEGCAVVLYFVTPRSVDREHCRREVNFALEQQCSILAVHLERTRMPSALKLSLSNRQAILAYELPRARYEEKLDAAIARAAAGLPGEMEADRTTPLRIGDRLVDPASGTLTQGETEAHLPPQTMAVLVYLARHPGEVVGNEELLEKVWQGRFTGDDSVYQHIGRIRRKLGDASKDPRYIETIPRRGYRLIAQTASVAGEPGDGPAAELTDKLAHNDPSGRRAPRAATLLALAVGLLLAGSAALYVYDALRGGAPAEAVVKRPSEQTAPPDKSLAVLPFTDLSQSGDSAVFAAGIHADLLNNLYQIPDIVVMSQAVVEPFAREHASTGRIASALLVAYVLDGSVRNQGERVRVNVRLTGTEDNRQVWAEQYDGTFTDIFQIENDIAAKVRSRSPRWAGPPYPRRPAVLPARRFPPDKPAARNRICDKLTERAGNQAYPMDIPPPPIHLRARG